MKSVQVGALLSEEVWNRLLDFLWANSDIFAWMASDMPGVFIEGITHKLNIDLKY